MDSQAFPQTAPGVVLGASWGSPWAFLSAPGLVWETYWGAWGNHLEHFSLIFVSPGGVGGEISEKLDFDDPLNENATFLVPRASK